MCRNHIKYHNLQALLNTGLYLDLINLLLCQVLTNIYESERLTSNDDGRIKLQSKNNGMTAKVHFMISSNKDFCNSS